MSDDCTHNSYTDEPDGEQIEFVLPNDYRRLLDYGVRHRYWSDLDADRMEKEDAFLSCLHKFLGTRAEGCTFHLFERSVTRLEVFRLVQRAKQLVVRYRDKSLNSKARAQAENNNSNEVVEPDSDHSSAQVEQFLLHLLSHFGERPSSVFAESYLLHALYSIPYNRLVPLLAQQGLTVNAASLRKRVSRASAWLQQFNKDLEDVIDIDNLPLRADLFHRLCRRHGLRPFNPTTDAPVLLSKVNSLRQ